MLFGDRYSQTDIQTDTDPQTTPVYISLWHGVKISTNSMDTTQTEGCGGGPVFPPEKIYTVENTEISCDQEVL